MKIHKIETGFLGVNTYFVINEETKECIVIDPGAYFQKLYKYVQENGLTVDAVLLTHGHFDHVGVVADFKNLGAKVYVHEEDAGMCEFPESFAGGTYAKYVTPFTPTNFVKDGEEFEVASMKVLPHHTPGHTRGGVTYKIGDNLFTGDTIFNRNVGRCDLPGGDFRSLVEGVKSKLFVYENMMVYPGHGEYTTIDEEKKFNPYLNMDI